MNNKLINYIKSDLYRYEENINIFTAIKHFVLNKGFRYMFFWRIHKSKSLVKYIGKMYIFFAKRGSIQIPTEAKIGYGLFIGHGGPICVNPSTVIGDNCDIYQFVTIGSEKGKAAQIGNNVYIGPSTCIVEDVKIGNNVTIGAGSVVTKDIPDNSTAVGNYAKVINKNKPGRFIKRKWKNEDK